MEKRKETGSRIGAFLAGAGLVSLILTLSFVWRPAREKLAAFLNPRPTSLATLAPTTDTTGRKILYYQDPMHPWYKSDKPGIAPDYGMKLVPVYADEQQTTAAGPLPPGAVQISPARQQLMGVTTAVADYRPVEKTIRTVGQVAIDETRLADVHVKVSGWIEKVFVDYTWQPVKKGDPLFTIYSPDLLATEQEYLLALRARKTLGASPYQEVSSGTESLLEAARRRLALWDLTDAQIKQLEESGKAQHELTFYAPASGYVMERKAFPNQYVTPDTELYKLVDLSRVWVQADVYEFEMPSVSLGQEATLTTESLPGVSWRGRLVFVNPEVKADTRTGIVRLEFPNPELKLKPGMFVNVELHKSFGRQLTVPVDAVLDSGTRQVVFVDLGHGVFAPREVKVGERTQDYAAILRGLRAGERVVTRANFLVDSESNLREAISGMPGMPEMKQEGQTAPPRPEAGEQQSMPGMPGMRQQGTEKK
jgi:RND family efflux transporter MFP subunit